MGQNPLGSKWHASAEQQMGQNPLGPLHDVPLTAGNAGSSVRLQNEARVMQYTSCVDSEVDELTKVLHNKDVKHHNFGELQMTSEEAEELSFIFDGHSHAFFMNVTIQFMFSFTVKTASQWWPRSQGRRSKVRRD